MDSVYDAALAHADKLKAELETLQNFLNLHDHFRDRFGLTPSPTAAATDQIDVEEPAAKADEAVEAQAPEVETSEAEAVEASEPEVVAASEPEAGASASEPEAVEPEASLHAEPEVEAEASSVEAAPEEAPRVIQASEGVLIAATSETAANEPLGPEATLQAVAEKLAATINATHPAVTGYTV